MTSVGSGGCGDIIPPLDQQKVLNEIEEELVSIEQEIQNQTNLKESLKLKIAELTADRIRNLPKAIQKEHDAVEDKISNLNWHLNESKRKLAQVVSRRDRSSMVTKRLKESIQTMEQNSPMIEEKLLLEQKHMQMIEDKQKEADKALEIATDELRKVERAHSVKVEILDQEKKQLDLKLNGLVA